MMNKKFFAAAIFATGAAFAGPITTVPWNGHDGAVSFTFDDGSSDQLQQLGSYLDANEDVKVTFFITGGMYAGASGNIGSYVNYAKKGHEIGNHSKSHKNMTEVSDLTTETSGWKSSLLQMGAPEVFSFATPYCASNNNVANAISKDHIANRNCAGAKYYGWGTEPNWMDISSNCYTYGGNSTNNAKGYMASAKSQKGWTVQLNHTVGTTDQYGISTNDMKSIMDEAKKQGLWIAPFGVVAAYYRAHFTLDKVTPTTTATGFKASWASPHSAMPKSVMLKVKIDGAAGKTVVQKGKAIAPNSDGTYTIDFMALELEVTGGDASEFQGAFKDTVALPGTVQAENYDKYAFSDADGKNDGVGYRADDAGIVKAGSGYALGYTTANDWFEYTVNAKVAGTYKVTVNGATGNAANGSVTISAGTKSVDVAVASKGDWDTYSESTGELELAAGINKLRLTVNDNYLNVDWIKFENADVEDTEDQPEEKDPSAITGKLLLNKASGNVQVKIFDVNGNLVKSMTSATGNARSIWNSAKSSLGNGAYIMRFGEVGKTMQTVRVAK